MPGADAHLAEEEGDEGDEEGVKPGGRGARGAAHNDGPHHALGAAPRQKLVPVEKSLRLVTFTVFEMLMATLSSLGLLYGAPTTIFVVFKSSKAVFMALMSVVILGRHLNLAQWSFLKRSWLMT